MKNLNSSYPERKYFERGANLLKEAIENKRISFSNSLFHFQESLLRVKMLPNGRLDLSTIDEVVRSNFHMLTSNVFDRYHEREK